MLNKKIKTYFHKLNQDRVFTFGKNDTSLNPRLKNYLECKIRLSSMKDGVSVVVNVEVISASIKWYGKINKSSSMRGKHSVRNNYTYDIMEEVRSQFDYFLTQTYNINIEKVSFKF